MPEYHIIKGVTSKPWKFFFSEVEVESGKIEKEYGRTLFRNSVSQVHAQKRVLRIERTLRLWNMDQHP